MTRRRRLRIDAPELNLVPLLDMVSLLIQMLLINAQFGVYAELRSTVATGAAEATGEQLGLSVRVQPQGFVVQWIEGGEGRERVLPCPANPCASLSAWDDRGLRELLAALRAAHPEEKSIVLMPETGVPFEAVAHTMDLVRQDAAGAPLYPDLVVGP